MLRKSPGVSAAWKLDCMGGLAEILIFMTCAARVFVFCYMPYTKLIWFLGGALSARVKSSVTHCHGANFEPLST